MRSGYGLRLGTQATVGTRIKVVPSFGKGTLPTLFCKVGGQQGYPSTLSLCRAKLVTWYSGPERQCKIRSQNTIPYIGTEILIFHCFCIMEMFLFSKSIIPDENSVKISRRIFLDRSQCLKCTKKLKNSLDPEAYFS